jgi:hypothetical protein
MKREDKTVRSIVSCIKNITTKDLKGCEVGIWEGRTSKKLLERLPNLFLHMVDPWKKEGIQFRKPKSEKIIKAAYLETLKNVEFAKNRCNILRMTSLQAFDIFDDSSLHFVYIDADHTYDGVKQDIQLWWPKVTHVLIGHDYDCILDKKGRWGVKKAVDEFSNEQGLDVNIHDGLVWSIKK